MPKTKETVMIADDLERFLAARGLSADQRGQRLAERVRTMQAKAIAQGIRDAMEGTD